MSIAAFGIVNKLNEPLYLLADCKSTASRTGSSSEETDQNEDDPSEVVNRHAIVFTALDAIEARRTKSSRASGPAGQLGESFLGLLFSIEDYRVYGSISNTLTKMVLLVETSPALSSEAVKELFLVMHRLYASLVMNPFHDINAPITSKDFDRRVRVVVERHNSRIAATSQQQLSSL